MITAITTSGIARMIWPMMSEMTSSGMKAAIVVKDELNTGAAMRLAPFTAASRGSSPRRARHAACSPTTIASSTTMPSAMIRPNRLTILIDWPLSSMIRTVANSEVGIPIATQKAVGVLRKMNRISSTRTRPPPPFTSSRLMRPLIRSDCTSYCSSLRFGGSSGRIFAR